MALLQSVSIDGMESEVQTFSPGNGITFGADGKINADRNPDNTYTKNEVDLMVDKDVVTSEVFTANASTVTQTETTTNLKNGTDRTQSNALPAASETSAGVINAATFKSIRDLETDVEALLNEAVAISGLPASPTQAQLTQAWQTALSTTRLPHSHAIIWDEDNTTKYTYYANTDRWEVEQQGTGGTVNVSQFTNSAQGLIKGSTADGQVFAETDGTGSVNGWDDLINRVNTLLRNHVTGVKGNSESSYRVGNVNLTADNIGAVKKTGDTMTGGLQITNPSYPNAKVYAGVDSEGGAVRAFHTDGARFVKMDCLQGSGRFVTNPEGVTRIATLPNKSGVIALLSDLPGVVTTSANGLMSATDKVKINKIGTFLSKSLSKSVPHGSVTNLDTFTITPGTWIILFNATFPANSTGRRSLMIADSATGTGEFSTTAGTSPNAEMRLQAVRIASVSVNTTYYPNVYQNSGAAMSVTGQIYGICIA